MSEDLVAMHNARIDVQNQMFDEAKHIAEATPRVDGAKVIYYDSAADPHKSLPEPGIVYRCFVIEPRIVGNITHYYSGGKLFQSEIHRSNALRMVMEFEQDTSHKPSFLRRLWSRITCRCNGVDPHDTCPSCGRNVSMEAL